MNAIHNKFRSEDLTVEEARNFESCKDLSDEEITQLLNAIKTLCEITFSIYSQNKEFQNESQQAA